MFRLPVPPRGRQNFSFLSWQKSRRFARIAEKEASTIDSIVARQVPRAYIKQASGLRVKATPRRSPQLLVTAHTENKIKPSFFLFLHC
jgi:predicted nucleic acid-binding Zn ribbon protein